MYVYVQKYCLSCFQVLFLKPKLNRQHFLFALGKTENEVKLRKSPATPQELDSLSWMAAKSISRSSFDTSMESKTDGAEGHPEIRSSYGAVDRSVEKRSTFKGTKWQRGKMRYQLSAIDGWHSTKSLAEQIALQRKRNRNLSHNSWRSAPTYNFSLFI